MESLIIDKTNLLNRIDGVIDDLKYIRNEIIKDIDLSELEMTQDIKESRFKETQQTLKPKKKKETYFSEEQNKPNKGYSDFYDINSRPNIKI